MDDPLAASILPWARETHRDKYDETLAVASKPKAFRKFLVRLVEIRWMESLGSDWIRQVPLSALEESKVQMKMKMFGNELIVSGHKVGDRSWSFAELAGLLADQDKDSRRATVIDLIRLKAEFDLRVMGDNEK